MIESNKIPKVEIEAEHVELKGANIPKLTNDVSDMTEIQKANLPADTTIEEDKKTKGQRDINLIWEVTQAIVALVVTAAIIYSEVTGGNSQILGNAFTLIIAIYFVRTNHIKVGGIGGTDDRR